MHPLFFGRASSNDTAMRRHARLRWQAFAQELATSVGQRFYARLPGDPLGRCRGDGASVFEAPCWNLPYAQALKTSRRTA